jgi:hypothetical protein
MRIEVLFLLVAFAMPCQVLPAIAVESVVNVVRNGQSVAVSRSEQVAGKLVALAESCSVNSTAYAVTTDSWSTALASGSFVQVGFKSPATLRLAGPGGQERQPYQVDALLLPLPIGRWPEHLLVQTGGKTVSLTKFDPLALKDLVVESDLRLGTALPYSSLVDKRQVKR